MDTPCHPSCKFLRTLGLAIVLVWPAMPLCAVTHSMLLRDSKMNAKRFAGNFQDFRYEFHSEVQRADDFLESERGDCDDYAILADDVLRRRKFTTVLVQVRFAGAVTHAVCYVQQAGAYLDYNNRNIFFTLSRSSGELREIAAKVAESLEVNWTSVSAFTYSYETEQKQMIQTIVRTDLPEQDGEADKSPPSRLLVQ